MRTNKVLAFGRSAISAIAILWASSGHGQALPTTPNPASAEPDDGAVEDIVITGSSLRGVAPIGSNLVSIGRDAIVRTGAISATELTNTVPAITTSGSAPVGENVFSYFSPQIHSLAGSASNTTLVIVDGLRMPGGGVQYAQTDPNIIPTSAIQRVEVLADGASSVYGSDAVAGVVNYITRRTFDGVEIGGKHGFADKWHSWDGNAILGKTWDTGGVYVAAQYSYQSPLHNSSRDFLSTGDYRSIGGRNVQSFNCSPATIRTPASGNNVYLTPESTSAVPNVANNAPCNLSIYGDAIQSNARGTVLARVTNTFGKLTTTGTINFNRLKGSRALGPGTITSATAFGPGSGRGGQINPFYLAPAGDAAAAQESVNYAAIRPDNKYGKQSASNDTFYLTGTAEYRFTDKASIKLSNAYGHSVSRLDARGIFCSSCAFLGLNGTSQSSGSTTASNVAGENVVTLNLPLTTTNALDIWRPNGGQTSAAVFNRLYSNNTALVHTNNFYQAKLEGQAELFSLPAGAVRMAIGGEYLTSSQRVESVDPQNTINTSKGATYISYLLKRKVASG
ncbi:MAG TPA: TonB-dependent receptor plug domain-containing protein, partial [Sphingomonas sp.]|nr:TonB-dependent receptor plug domain-containing protein [Sphingomonas sp.]